MKKGQKLSPLTRQQPEAKLDTLCLMRKLDLSSGVTSPLSQYSARDPLAVKI